MLKKINLIVLLLLFSNSSLAAETKAEVRELDSKNQDIVFTIVLNKIIEGEKLKIDSQFVSGKEAVLVEKATINNATSDIYDYKVTNNQTQESGDVKIVDNKVSVEYKAKDKDPIKKEFAKPKYFVAPANFELWLQKNFETLKKDGKMSIDFLIWDKLDTYKFKVTYLGEQKFEGETTQAFKMNIDNFILASFISPIRIWYSQDMSRILAFKGRLAVKKANSSGGFSDFDGDVKYIYTK